MKEKLAKEMNLGEGIKDFLRTDIGIYIMDRIDKYDVHLLEEFRTVSARDEEAVLKLQSLSEVPRLFTKWLSEAIEAGEAAEFQLKEEDEEFET